MKLRPAYTKDINEIVAMYKDLISIVYPSRKLGSDYHFYKVVISWIDHGHNIFIVEHENIAVGFYLAYVDNMNGLTEPVYYVQELFIKEDFRKTKAFYMMLENIKATVKKLNILLVCDAVPGILSIYHKFSTNPVLQKFEKRF